MVYELPALGCVVKYFLKNSCLKTRKRHFPPQSCHTGRQWANGPQKKVVSGKKRESVTFLRHFCGSDLPLPERGARSRAQTFRAAVGGISKPWPSGLSLVGCPVMGGDRVSVAKKGKQMQAASPRAWGKGRPRGWIFLAAATSMQSARASLCGRVNANPDIWIL